MEETRTKKSKKEEMLKPKSDTESSKDESSSGQQHGGEESSDKSNSGESSGSREKSDEQKPGPSHLSARSYGQQRKASYFQKIIPLPEPIYEEPELEQEEEEKEDGDDEEEEVLELMRKDKEKRDTHGPATEVFKRRFDEFPFDPFKVIVMGDVGAGKTSIIRRYVNRAYSPEYSATVGVDLIVKDVPFYGKILKLHIWDIAGEERSRYVTRALFREVHGAFVVHDATREDTYHHISRWKEAMDNSVSEPDGGSVPAILLYNKVDLIPGGQLQIPDTNLKQLYAELDFVRCFQTSAKDNVNVDLAFFHMIRKMIVNRKRSLKMKREQAAFKIALSQEPVPAPSQKCSC